jgi:lipopolysaccharide O-acetyltransferase
LGRGVLVASQVYITDHDHDFGDLESPPIENGRLVVVPTHIGDYVWLGEGVMVLKGVTIGAHSVVGAGSIVIKDIPPFCVAVGNPAKVIRFYCHEKKQWIKVND